MIRKIGLISIMMLALVGCAKGEPADYAASTDRYASKVEIYIDKDTNCKYLIIETKNSSSGVSVVQMQDEEGNNICK